AISMGKRILPFPPSGGAARQAYERMQSSARLRAWLPADIFAALGSCATGSEFTTIIEGIFAETGSTASE
ncbi:MAG TPA: hypothetical protein VMV17_14830, partial [Streptosporangiaceae bacterium]|nr:hypothetical protein [Streptosporangiaceae bacterium]